MMRSKKFQILRMKIERDEIGSSNENDGQAKSSRV